jgi:hypothetical protein
VFADTGATGVVAAAPVGEATSWVSMIVPIAVSAMAAIMAFISKYVLSYLKTLNYYAKASADEKAIYDLILQGVFSNQSLVAAIKEAAADGKLTSDEIARLKIAAIEYAQSIATPELKEKLIALGRTKLEVMIEQALASITK